MNFQFSFQAYDQPDVYETADNIPEQETSDYYEEEVDNEHIERLHISTKDSFNRFKGKYLSGNVDFSDRIGKNSRPGYDAKYVSDGDNYFTNNHISSAAQPCGSWSARANGRLPCKSVDVCSAK